MAISQKALNEKLRTKYMALVRESLEQLDEQILVIGSNEWAIPCLDENGNDSFVTMKFSVPTGSRDGEPFDGFTMAEIYSEKVAENERKAQERAEAKERKKVQDAKRRAKLAESKALHGKQ